MDVKNTSTTATQTTRNSVESAQSPTMDFAKIKNALDKGPPNLDGLSKLLEQMPDTKSVIRNIRG